MKQKATYVYLKTVHFYDCFQNTSKFLNLKFYFEVHFKSLF